MRPTLVAHADWGSAPAKRRLARAVLDRDRYVAQPPRPAGPPESLLADLLAAAPGGGPALLGVDFPIGLPAAYAQRAGIARFLDALPTLDQRFYTPAARPDEIALARPFYPSRPALRGEQRRQHLAAGLGLAWDQLYRACDRSQPGRPAACALFWTLGGSQVGKAAISGWRDMLAPAVRDGAPPVALWPFAGGLDTLLRHGAVVVAETYPAEAYGHLGVRWAASRPGVRSGKRVQGDRRANAQPLLQNRPGVELTPALRAQIADGFGAGPGGEDSFDSTVGLLFLLEIVLGRRDPGEPTDQTIRDVEGWIIGQAP